MTRRERVFEAVREILRKEPTGALRYSDLLRKVKEACPDIKENTIVGALHALRERIKSGHIKDIEIPSKGIFRLMQDKEEPISIKEEDLYQPFADYLTYELKECTKAVPLGRKVFDEKWGTPDVFGVYKFPDYEPIKLPVPEVVSAEIKLDPNQLVVAFGQACSYKLFSHKVYLVVPNQESDELVRLESLCIRFGLGDYRPKFQIRTRALKGEPDYFYLNNNLNKLKQKDPKKFKDLFG